MYIFYVCTQCMYIVAMSMCMEKYTKEPCAVHFSRLTKKRYISHFRSSPIDYVLVKIKLTQMDSRISFCDEMKSWTGGY